MTPTWQNYALESRQTSFSIDPLPRTLNFLSRLREVGEDRGAERGLDALQLPRRRDVVVLRPAVDLGHVNMYPWKHVPLDFENKEILSTLRWTGPG